MFAVQPWRNIAHRHPRRVLADSSRAEPAFGPLEVETEEASIWVFLRRWIGRWERRLSTCWQRQEECLVLRSRHPRLAPNPEVVCNVYFNLCFEKKLKLKLKKYEKSNKPSARIERSFCKDRNCLPRVQSRAVECECEPKAHQTHVLTSPSFPWQPPEWQIPFNNKKTFVFDISERFTLQTISNHKDKNKTWSPSQSMQSWLSFCSKNGVPSCSASKGM